MNILMLDDNYEDFASLLKVCLKGSAFTFTRTPHEARQRLDRQKFDVMLLDGNLGPGVTGPQVLEGWKAQGLPLPPVVMLSADAELRAEGMEAGAVAAIDKGNCYPEDFTSLERFATNNGGPHG